MTLTLPQDLYDQLRAHGEETYPHECCGVLVGTVSGSGKCVAQAVPVRNASPVNKRHHYLIDPVELIRVERQARASGWEILGFYHSHPDHPAEWSPTDLKEAHWMGCSYAITTVVNGLATETRSFHLAGSSEENKRFEAEEIQLLSNSLESEE